MAMFIGAWMYCRRPAWWTLAFWVAATASLYMINRNHWALAAFAVIFAAPHVQLAVPRIRTVFYAYYPLHFAALWCATRLL
jgi:hypothetical protein